MARGAALFAGAAALTWIAVLLSVAAAVAGIALELPVWAAILVVLGAVLLLAAVLALLGRSAVRHAKPPVPEQAIEEARLTSEVLRDGL